ncbi:MAG: isoaspartyl peptidase/L-asparaginase [Bacteroidota bacterium]
MSNYYLFLFSLLLLGACQSTADTDGAAAQQSPPAYAMVIHGGAGPIRPENMTPEKETAIRAALNEALDTGEAILSAGGSSADAVEATLHILEDSPYFNAGRGAVFTHDGTNALDASFMTGHDRQAGAVSGVSNIQHPISLARKVLEESEHVMLSGKGAEEFALRAEMDTIDPSWFYTERRYESLQRILEEEREAIETTGQLPAWTHPDQKFGTVGCVALDQEGNIAAGTSTGGMTNKRYDRIGDSPIIGAGTFADNTSCGVSCTGHGEYFIRWAVAYDLHARMIYGGASLEEAAKIVVHEVLPEVGGGGGLIALDRFGNIVMPFNTHGMYRGHVKAGEERVVALYK